MNSELRQSMVSGDWVLIAPGRAKRPGDLLNNKKQVKRRETPKRECPFESLLASSGGEMPLLQYGTGDNWRLGVIENRYPALSHGANCPVFLKKGPYHYLGGIGRHELIITRDHRKNFAELSAAAAGEVFTAAIERFKHFKNDACLQYVSLFQNYGSRAGASQSHPHYQIMAVPVVPPEINYSLANSKRYYRKHGKCAHCVLLGYELKEKKRIVYANAHAVVVAPFASTHSFEFRVFPRKHRSCFQDTSAVEIAGVVAALQKTLGALRRQLGDPDYNFFIHTAPIKNSAAHKNYHWHVEVMPRMEIFAGFELGTGMVINPTSPEIAAAFLRKGL